VAAESTTLRDREGLKNGFKFSLIGAAATVYEGECTHGNQLNFHNVSAEGKQEEANPHASSRILEHEPDRVALRRALLRSTLASTRSRRRVRTAPSSRAAERPTPVRRSLSSRSTRSALASTPAAAIGIVPENGLQRPHGSRVILGLAERADSPRALVRVGVLQGSRVILRVAERADCTRALVRVGVLQTFAHVILSWLTRPQRCEQKRISIGR